MHNPPDTLRNDARPLPRDTALRDRARKVIPGGMWGHMDARRLPHGYPQFFAGAKGTRLRDVDGNEYVDFMCSYGPMILGYGDPDVEAAADAQRARMGIANGPGEILVELAELMVDTVPAADWALFAKNGTDATTACVTIARAHGGRRKVLVARGAYHGSAPWCTPWPAGTTAEDRAHLIYYTYNDVASLKAAAEAAGEDLAGILVSAFRHDGRVDQEMPTREFAGAARALADSHDAALILDDVRAGFRLHPGGSWEPLGVRPDLAAWSKALGNGYPIAAVTGNDRMRDAARQIFVTGSFWCGPVPMAAAAATLAKLGDGDAVAHMARMGTLLREGIQAQADALGVGLRQTGPAQLPLMLFDDDPKLERGDLFAVTALRHGVYLHPWHNMFLSAAHTEDDIEIALKATGKALEAVARAFP
ncbi:aminotransferase class III-fold pyridoxal phosphate-dependent enzyme [Kaustia mangrovi]|uniref:Aminotransferase class III-fold pyridoxal phosphate-dependent enzyme n=1 Tax=Kaustia mangrovi TaxID=2593653 RepID=A0A7S8HBE3_9HYPH|nr:aminotransferase class III-fold pyridoxal phosphate-dependent enzyme [Kaustia mangrovi]QPC42510.1 aminotransferase class III-fold pyridoxal phosphate-dependent enzyme [Kaustia mangrovi]